MGHNPPWRRDDRGPVHPVTLRTQRRVAVVWENHQAADRLNDVTPALLERDPRVQLVHVLGDGSRFSASAASYARHFDGLVLPWEQATAFDYDLALAANNGHNSHLEQLRAPTVTMPHGIGFSRVVRPGSGFGPPLANPPVVDAVYSTIVRYGRVTPAAIAVAHQDHRAVLAGAVPEAAPITHVVGDPVFDRALSALPDRARFRRAVGVDEGQRLVLLSSSWGKHSLLGRHPELVDRVVAELPRDHLAAAVIHPGVWSAHSPRQVRSWFSGARRRGLRILAPTAPWMGLVMASDVVIGDHGSTTYYASALGAPVLLAGGGPVGLAPRSQLEALHAYARRYRAEVPLAWQVEEAVATREPDQAAVFGGLLTSEPGRSAELLRALLYRTMGLDEPDTPAGLAPLREPRFLGAFDEEEDAA